MHHCIALIVAAGRGDRFGGELPKQYVDLAGAPVLRRSALAYLGHPHIRAVRCVIGRDDLPLYEAAVRGLDLLAPVCGGAERQESVRLGLESLVGENADLVLIHDAARPLVEHATISRCIEAASAHGAAIAAVPVHDALKRQDERGDIAASIDRDRLWRAQTPQAFRFDAILAAHRACRGATLPDDAAVAAAARLPVRLAPGSEENIKITETADLRRAEAILRGRAGITRTGHGLDVHRFGPGDHVVIGGVRIPHEAALTGHSDADVALHALTDALLGTIAAGDIGQHFPPDDPRWRGADSAIFLEHAARLVRDRGGLIDHVDVTIVCERPKIGPYRRAIMTRIAGLLALGPGAVSVKATTSEGLGFTGRGEGIAAQAVATVRVPPEDGQAQGDDRCRSFPSR